MCVCMCLICKHRQKWALRTLMHLVLTWLLVFLGMEHLLTPLHHCHVDWDASLHCLRLQLKSTESTSQHDKYHLSPYSYNIYIHIYIYICICIYNIQYTIYIYIYCESHNCLFTCAPFFPGGSNLHLCASAASGEWGFKALCRREGVLEQ